MRVLITGGTGRLAKHVLSRPRASDFSWRLLSRRPASGSVPWVVGDLVTGRGLPEALDGIDAVLHLASDPAHPGDDVRAVQQLVAAAGAAGVRHLLFLSIIGVDRIPLPYYQAKFAAEEIIAAAGVPRTILRAAQFHSFVDELLRRAILVPGLILVPAGFKVQSVSDEEMADHLLDALRAGPAGRARDFVGPEILRVSDAARSWRQARHLSRAVVPIPVPGAVAGAFRAGENTAPNGERGREAWREWLRRRYEAPRP